MKPTATRLLVCVRHVLNRGRLQHPAFAAAVEKGKPTRTALLVSAVTCLHLGGPDCCSASFLVAYLSAYSGTLSDDDRAVRSALLMMEAHSLSPKMLDYAWGATAQAKAASSSIVNTSGKGAFGWLWTPSGTPAGRLQYNIQNFPLCMKVPQAEEGLLSTTMPRVFRMGPDTQQADNPHAHTRTAHDGTGRVIDSASWTGEESQACPHKVQSLLDPTYVLPVICGALSSGSLHDVVTAMEGGALAYGVMAAAAKDEALRRLGYQVLELALQHVEEAQEKKSGVTRDWTSLAVVLKSLRDSITQPLQRIPLPVAAFVAESIGIVTRPSHALFSAVTRYLLTRPFFDHAEVPHVLFCAAAEEPLPRLLTPLAHLFLFCRCSVPFP